MASERMLQFVKAGQAYPAKREPELRAQDFQEIADRYAPATAD